MDISFPKKYSISWTFFLRPIIFFIFILVIFIPLGSIFSSLAFWIIFVIIEGLIIIFTAMKYRSVGNIEFDADTLHISSKYAIPYAVIVSLTTRISTGRGTTTIEDIIINNQYNIPVLAYGLAESSEMANLLKTLAPQAQTDERFEFMLDHHI
jgi:hypothetical protein